MRYDLAVTETWSHPSIRAKFILCVKPSVFFRNGALLKSARKMVKGSIFLIIHCSGSGQMLLKVDLSIDGSVSAKSEVESGVLRLA